MCVRAPTRHAPTRQGVGHNLARYLQRLGQETHVVRSDATDAAEIRLLKPTAIVISPGPCTPVEAGCSVSVVREMWDRVPILGVCLGHQSIAAGFGVKIVRAPSPMHGRISEITHNGRDIFENIPSPLTVCRYHSLVVDEPTLPRELQVTARTSDGVIMALQHRAAPVFGLQFHPEAILTEFGYPMLANFLRIAGLTVPSDLPRIEDERIQLTKPTTYFPDQPLTF